MPFDDEILARRDETLVDVEERVDCEDEEFEEDGEFDRDDPEYVAAMDAKYTREERDVIVVLSRLPQSQCRAEMIPTRWFADEEAYRASPECAALKLRIDEATRRMQRDG